MEFLVLTAIDSCSSPHHEILLFPHGSSALAKKSFGSRKGDTALGFVPSSSLGLLLVCNFQRRRGNWQDEKGAGCRKHFTICKNGEMMLSGCSMYEFVPTRNESRGKPQKCERSVFHNMTETGGD
jgi:hypothetical protein